MRKLPFIVLLLALALVFAGCSSPAATPSPAPTTADPADNSGKDLTVFAAASLTESFNEIGAAFTANTAKSGGAKVTFNFGGSNTLRAQIEQGAQGDVFASANTTEMNTLVKGGLIVGDPQTFAKNRLVVITPKANPGKIESLKDLAKTGIKIVVAGPDVPVGKYALQMLDKMSADATYGADFKDKVSKNFISQETDVKQVVAKIQLGEGDAGVVYLTDVTSKVAPELNVLDVPDAFNQVATYPLGVLKNTKQSELAQAFVSFVLSSDGQAILKKANFAPAK